MLQVKRVDRTEHTIWVIVRIFVQMSEAEARISTRVFMESHSGKVRGEPELLPYSKLPGGWEISYALRRKGRSTADVLRDVAAELGPGWIFLPVLHEMKGLDFSGSGVWSHSAQNNRLSDIAVAFANLELAASAPTRVS